jgi:putative ABC transport system permease protein
MYVYIFSVAALGILILAVVNFVNLSTARSANRAREVGIRKTVGSTRSGLVRQFLLESLLYAFFSTVLAVLMVELAFPYFQQLTGKSLHIPYGNPATIPLILGFILVVGLLAGLYPAFFLSTFRPVSVLKNDIDIIRRPWTRSVLVVFQFSVAITLLVGMFVVHRQVKYIQEQKLTAAGERILLIHKTDDLGNEIRSFKWEILKHPGVLVASNSDRIVGGSIGDGIYSVPERPDAEKRVIHHIFTDADFGSVYNLELTDGAFFPGDFAPDRRGLVLNESTKRLLDMENPIGRLLKPDGREVLYPIVGVVKDFHYRSLHHTIAPLIIHVLGREPFGGREISVRIASENVQKTIADLEATWKRFSGNQAFEYEFFDDYYDSLYRVELRTGSVFVIFSIFALFIAALGLFGLSAFVAEQRTKEIGIRKVLGATSGSIVIMLTKQFAVWVLVSTTIAWPVAYVIMSRWLQNFAYRDSIQIWTFLYASLLALVTAVLTVNYQSMKAAKLDPVESLKYE